MTDERTIAPPRAETPRLWTVAELAAAVARALSYDYEGTGNGRVTDVPGVRVIRWYQTIGLVDRPAEMRGRTALYGPRHLRQIVAIKRLQSGGRSLAEIQEALVGVPDEVLDQVARVPEGVWDEAGAVSSGAGLSSTARSGAVPSGAVPSSAASPGSALSGPAPSGSDSSDPASSGAVPSPVLSPAAELVDAASLPVAVEVEGAAAAEPARGRFWANRAVAGGAGSDGAGSDGAGSDGAGLDGAESGGAGSISAGSDSADSDGAGSNSAGSSGAGSNSVGSSSAESNSAASDRAVAQSAEQKLAVSAPSPADTATSAEFSYGIPLAPGVTVLVSLPHPPSAAAVGAIRVAAAPLVAELAAHRQDGAVAPDASEPSVSSSTPSATPSAKPSTTPSTTHAPAARGLTEGASS